MDYILVPEAVCRLIKEDYNNDITLERAKLMSQQ
jgi:hypothetical protein